MEKKICPLLTRSAAKPVCCLGEKCAWWCVLYSQIRGKTGSCALLEIARSIDT